MRHNGTRRRLMQRWPWNKNRWLCRFLRQRQDKKWAGSFSVVLAN
jgi:hypothetical protein